jgi:hypothetical protein
MPNSAFYTKTSRGLWLLATNPVEVRRVALFVKLSAKPRQEAYLPAVASVRFEPPESSTHEI